MKRLKIQAADVIKGLRAHANLAVVDSTARAANMPPHENKISSFILKRINRMIPEQAKPHPNPFNSTTVI